MSKQIAVSRGQWNKEFASGKWDYLDQSPIERARHAIIGMLCGQYAPKGKILDVGCGEGTLADFLDSTQVANYQGLDISEEAAKKAKEKRGLKVLIADAATFESKRAFDIIVFNEMLYYVDDRKLLQKYADLLNKNGTLILSVYRTQSKRYDRRILKNARTLFNTVDIAEVSGTTKRQKVTWHIESFKGN